MRDDRSAYDPPSIREYRRQNRPRIAGVIIAGAVALAIAAMSVASVSVISYWVARGR